MEKMKAKSTDSFCERLLKNYMWWKLRHKGAVLLFGEFKNEGQRQSNGFYIVLFDDALWISACFNRPVLDLKGIPLTVIPNENGRIDYLSQWISLQTKTVQVRKKFEGLPIQEIEQNFLH